MTVKITEIAPEIFHIYHHSARFSYVGCYLIRDEHPTMVGTNLKCSFDEVHGAVRTLIDPTTLRYLCLPWLAMDNCGSLNQFLAIAPAAEPVCSPIGKLMFGDFSDRAVRVLGDGARLELGSRNLVGVLTPWVPAWESMMFFEETAGILFTADLFVTQPMENSVSHDDQSDTMAAGLQHTGILPSAAFLEAALRRIEVLDVKMFAPHHAPVLVGNMKHYYRALREHKVTDAVEAPFFRTGTLGPFEETAPRN